VEENAILVKYIFGLRDIITHRHSVTKGVVEFPPGIGSVKIDAISASHKKGYNSPAPIPHVALPPLGGIHC
jgi:hypothetical protein